MTRLLCLFAAVALLVVALLAPAPIARPIHAATTVGVESLSLSVTLDKIRGKTYAILEWTPAGTTDQVLVKVFADPFGNTLISATIADNTGQFSILHVTGRSYQVCTIEDAAVCSAVVHP